MWERSFVKWIVEVQISPSDELHWLELSEAGLRFPGHILGPLLGDTESSHHQLSSFNLNLGDFGQARLVASLHADQGSLVVRLSAEANEDKDEVNMECSLLVVGEEGALLHQVTFCL